VKKEGRTALKAHDGMESARGAAKRQRVSTVESALANIDVLGLLATFLEADDLRQVRATCKALGCSDEAAFDGLSMTEAAARRVFEGASHEEKAVLPWHDCEGWIEQYHHLLMLRARLTFDQLVDGGIGGIEYQAGDKAVVQTTGAVFCSAICGNHIMRAGKHWATFIGVGAGSDPYCSVGVIRPLPGLEHRELEGFHPSRPQFREDLRRERTSRWEGDVHFCHFYFRDGGECWYSNWEDSSESNWDGFEHYDDRSGELGMLLDLDSGTLSLYQNGLRLGTLKDGLAGVYCWIACLPGLGGVSIKRGYDVIDTQVEQVKSA